MENRDLVFQPLDAEEQKDYIQATAYEAETIGLEYSYESGTIPIDEELARQAIYAVSSRIDATREYTQNRIDRVNKNYTQGGHSDLGEKDTIAKFAGDETYQACEEWIDDIVGAFKNLEENIQIKDRRGTIHKMKSVIMEDIPNDDKEVSGLLESLQSNIGLASQKKESPYYIKYGDAIKAFSGTLIKKSGLPGEVETLATHAVVAGLFSYKKMPGACKEAHIVMHKDSESTGLGRFVKQVSYDEYLKFIPVDSRNLIFRKRHKDGDWVIEKINTRFSELVSRCTDAEGNTLKNAPYDMDMLRELSQHIRRGYKLTQQTKTVDSEQSTYNASVGDDEIFDIDGDVVVYEAHFVDLKLSPKYSGMNKATSTKSLISMVQLGGEESGQFIPIGIEPYRFTECQIEIIPFLFRDGDSAGMGLPEVLERIQEDICDLLALQEDFLMMALYGILFIDETKLVNPDAVKNMGPREAIKVKSLNGAPISSIYSFFTPPMEMVSYVSSAITYLKDKLDRLTRKGPSSERMTPKVTATEFSSIAGERKKSVDRVLGRIRPYINAFVSDAYAFALANMEKSSYELEVRTIKAKERTEKTNGTTPVEYQDRTVEFNLEELFAEGLEFEICAFENEDDMALQKQQNLEFTNMLMNFGLYDPQTGQARQFVNDAGTPVELNLWAIISKMATQFGYAADDIWKEIQTSQPPAAALPQLSSPNPGMPSPGSASNLQQSPETQMPQQPTEANMLGALAGGPFQ